MPRSRRHRVLRGVGIALAVLLVLLAAAALAVQPIVSRRTHYALEHVKGMWGTFDHVEVNLAKLSYSIHDLRIDRVERGRREPFVHVRRLEAGLYWSELVRGHGVGALLLEHPKLEIHSRAEADRDEKPPTELPEDLGRTLQKFVPFRLDRGEVRDGELLWVNERVPERPRLWFHRIDGTLENFATRAALARGEPSVLALSGTMGKSGEVSIFASADPLAKGLTFAGSARVKGFDLVELGSLLAATTGVAPKHGKLDVAARFKCVDGHLSGGIRPVLRNPDVQQAKPGLGNRLNAALADLSISILSDRVPGRNAVATTIPIEGDITRRDAKVWPTVVGVLRNAFVAGLSDSLANLPPKSAHEEESPAQQARRPPATRSSLPKTRPGEE